MGMTFCVWRFECGRVFWNMKPKTEELLYLLMWGVDLMMRPTFSNLTGSFEGWALRKGLLPRIRELEDGKLVEKRSEAGREMAGAYMLSDLGRITALGGFDPAREWGRGWDGCWRLVVFDVPQINAGARARLRRFLRASRFGYLQNSVWVSPHPLDDVSRGLSARFHDVESLLTLAARPGSGETDSQIVAGAWDFEKINGAYQSCLDLLGEGQRLNAQGQDFPESWVDWCRRERVAWQAALRLDPLLPDKLLPGGYLGRTVWDWRTRLLTQGPDQAL